jgi:TRAP-type C4-dicarboxylate transport system substrate-binding protein
MKKLSRLLVGVLVVVMLAGILASCASPSTPGGSPAAPAPAATKAKVTVCGTNGPGDTQSMAHEEFAKRLNALGNWEADAKVSSEMGSTDEVTEQARQGAPVIAASDPSRIASFVPDFGILMMPYLLDEYAQLGNLMDTDLYKGWVSDFEEKGIVLLTNNCLTGFRNWVTNKVINEPADLNGLKIRTMENPIALGSVNAMGGIATPMAQSEAAQAISNKTIDGGEWQLPTVYSGKFYEVAKNISLSKHFLLTGSIVCGVKWFDTLSEQQQTELKDNAVGTYGDNQAIVIEYEQKYLDEMQQKYGVTVTNPNIQSFKDATASLYDDKNVSQGADFQALRTELYKQLGIG